MIEKKDDELSKKICDILNMVLDQAIVLDNSNDVVNKTHDKLLLDLKENLKEALECVSHRLFQKKIYEVHNQGFIQTAINEDILGELYLYRLYIILENQNILDQNLIVNYKKDTNLFKTSYIMSPLKGYESTKRI